MLEAGKQFRRVNGHMCLAVAAQRDQLGPLCRGPGYAELGAEVLVGAVIGWSSSA
jgi:hypothetical protein